MAAPGHSCWFHPVPSFSHLRCEQLSDPALEWVREWKERMTCLKLLPGTITGLLHYIQIGSFYQETKQLKFPGRDGCGEQRSTVIGAAHTEESVLCAFPGAGSFPCGLGLRLGRVLHPVFSCLPSLLSLGPCFVITV